MPEFDPRTPSIARVYDYLLGGKDNFAADREAGDRLIGVFPAVVEAARENRQFLARAVTWTANQGSASSSTLEAASASLDLTVPTCVIMALLLHFYDPGTARSLVARYSAALAPGSYLIISMAHGNGEDGERWFQAYSSGPAPARNYSVAEVTALFDGTELVSPGVVDARQWHPGWSDLPALPFRTGQAICGVGRIG